MNSHLECLCSYMVVCARGSNANGKKYISLFGSRRVLCMRAARRGGIRCNLIVVAKACVVCLLLSEYICICRVDLFRIGCGARAHLAHKNESLKSTFSHIRETQRQRQRHSAANAPNFKMTGRLIIVLIPRARMHQYNNKWDSPAAANFSRARFQHANDSRTHRRRPRLHT